ncbi:MAG: hypothetical protein QXN24_00375 [Candidatus Bathyarchaeia archaeon]
MDQRKILLIGFLILTTTIISLSAGKASGNLDNTSNFSINVDRKIIILNGGYIMVNDTFTFFMKENIQLPSFHLVGIPRNYYRNLVYLAAYDSYNPLKAEFSEEDDAFKWFKIYLETDKISGKQSYNFTLTTIFSDLIKRKDESEFRAVFPLYPSLRVKSDLCNITLILPPNAGVSPEGFPRETFLNMTSDFRLLNNVTSPLPAYLNASSWVEFSDASFSILKILEVRREISVDEWGRIYVTDLYDTVMVNIDSFRIILPPGSANIAVYDIYDRYSDNDVFVEKSEHGVFLSISLRDRLKRNERTRIAVLYSLPTQSYIERKNLQVYSLKVNITRPDEWFIPKIIVSVLLPEGASIINGGRHPSAKYEKIELFREKFTLEYYNITRYESLSPLCIDYQYAFLWAAFRPTMLAIILIGLASIISVLIKPPGKTTYAITFSPETLTTFLQACEEMEDIYSKIESLREEYIRGKIPKRRYRLMKKMLEEQLRATRKKIMDLKTQIESTRDPYADLMKQLERAINDIEDARRSIDEVDMKLRQGEISVGEHRKLIDEYTGRISRAKSLIEEAILKIKEEI